MSVSLGLCLSVFLSLSHIIMEIASQPDSLLMCVTIFSQSLSEAKPSWPTPWYSIVDLSKRTWSKPRSCFLYKLLSLTHQLILFNLQEMTVKIWDNAKCKNTYGNAAPGGIMDHMLCAGEQGRDSCSVSNIIFGKQGQPVHMNDDARHVRAKPCFIKKYVYIF